MAMLNYIKIIICISYVSITFASEPASEAKAMSYEDFETQFTTRQHIEPADAQTYVSLLVENKLLTPEEIAEILRINTSTVQHLIEGKDCPRLYDQLEWYYGSAKFPISKLKKIYDDSIISKGNITEKDYIDSNKYYLLPKKFKNKEKIRNFIYTITQRDPLLLSILADTLHLSSEQIDTFLNENDQRVNKDVTQALRDYYRKTNVVPLCDVLEQKRQEYWTIDRIIINFFSKIINSRGHSEETKVY
jgi:hypothetical protein